MITSLTPDGKNFIGEAKIMSTPMGEIVKSLMDEGAKLGVSSRGMGSLDQKGGATMLVKTSISQQQQTLLQTPRSKRFRRRYYGR